jgi:hypothetical protein
MRIAREITTMFASLFGPATPAAEQAAQNPSRRTRSSEGSPAAGGYDPAAQDQTGAIIDRVSLSGQAGIQAAALEAGRDSRLDLPSPLVPAVDRQPAGTGYPGQSATASDRQVTALLPAPSVDRQQPRSTSDSPQIQESPETRRLVRSAYGTPQTAALPAEGAVGSHIRIRA